MGEILRIRLADGSFAYAQVLPKLFAFFALKNEAEIASAEVARQPVLLIVAVHKSARKIWHSIGTEKIENQLLNDVRFCKLDRLSKRTFIYTSKAFPVAAYDMAPAPPSECIGLEPLVVWDPDQMERRLQLIFEGRDDPFVENYRRELSEMLH